MYLTNPDNFSEMPPGPSNIFIIRHGEKNKNHSSKNEYYYTLNCNGIERSCKLPDFINDLGKSGTPIFAIITCQPSMNSSTDDDKNSMRPESTAMLSSFLLNIPMYIYSGANVSQPYTGVTPLQLFTNPMFQGKNVLIVWEHKNIQALTNQIVQCYNYLAAGNSVDDLTTNSENVFSIQDTSNWWINNTPIPPSDQYISSDIPSYPMPYTSYSQLLPYWNKDDYDKVYKFSQTSGDLTLILFRENITTHYQNCQLSIGMLQYEGQSHYSHEGDCVPPGS